MALPRAILNLQIAKCSSSVQVIVSSLYSLSSNFLKGSGISYWNNHILNGFTCSLKRAENKEKRGKQTWCSLIIPPEFITDKMTNLIFMGK